MKFIADGMLGRLARFLRFHGYDVEYDADAEDDTLLRKSRQRVLLTKDRQLAAKVTPARVYLVQTTGAESQFAEVQRKFPLRTERFGKRCLLCNNKIRRIQKQKIEHLVPPFVFRRYPEFYFCRSCRRVYWQGTHFEGMFRVIK